MSNKKIVIEIKKKRTQGAAEKLIERSENAITTPTGPNSIDIVKKDEIARKLVTARIASGLPPSKQAMRTLLIERFVAELGYDQRGATLHADAYIGSKDMAQNTQAMQRQQNLEDIEVAEAQDTIFVASARETASATFADIENIVREGQNNSSEQNPHRPGHAPAGASNGDADTYNIYKYNRAQERVASLRVLTPTLEDAGEDPNEPLKGFRTIFETNEFLLQQTNEQRTEKFQIVETFGEPIIFTYGSKAEIYTYAGTLLNTENFQWKNKFNKNYEEFFRASKAVLQDARIYLTYDDVIREGHIVSYGNSLTDRNLNHVQFTFSMYITKRIFLGNETDLLTDGERERKNELAAQGEAANQGTEVSFANDPTAFAYGEIPAGSPLIGFTSSGSIGPQLKQIARNKLIDSNGQIMATSAEITAQDLGVRDNGLLYDILPAMEAIN